MKGVAFAVAALAAAVLPHAAFAQTVVSIGDAMVSEGNAGATEAVFPVTLSQASAGDVSVEYYTVDGTASAGSDYVRIPLTKLIFLPGESRREIRVQVFGDTTPERTENFAVRLMRPVNATLGTKGSGLGTITNDDGTPPPLACTHSGTAAGEHIMGTTGRDVICGFGGNDTIHGLGGADVVYGGSGADTIDGGAGDDSIFGQDGLDTLNGGDGVDVVNGGARADVITGGAANDRLLGAAGADHIAAGAGMDRLTGGLGRDVFRGQAGGDTFFARDGLRDVVSGGAGVDRARVDRIDRLRLVERRF